jgi:hypothetical protein
VSDIFREIDEELRRDNLLKLWQRYGSWLIAAAVLLVAVTGAFVGWRAYQQHQREAAGVRYSEALQLASGGQSEQALDSLRKLAAEGDYGHALVARFAAAAVQAKAGDVAGAVASYSGIAADTSVDTAYRNLASLLAAMHGLETTEPKTIIERLQPLAADDSPWRATALELTALAQIRAGDRAAAIDIYKRLADDLAAPAALRARATEMISALGAS